MLAESDHIRINEKKWDRWSEIADGKGFLFNYLRKGQDSLISILDIKENITFLDLGCGTGWAVGRVAMAAGNAGFFYGVDLSEGMIEKAKKNFPGNDNIHFIRSNSESIPLEGDMFDIIICTNSFHHYLHPDRAMSEIHRLLKPGARVYILDMTADSLLIKFADKIIKLFEPQHVKLYSTGEFKGLMHNAGLNYSGTRRVASREKIHIGQK
jgi:ubiquinone/menaquinone biosynthesis C-methylase UbiE